MSTKKKYSSQPRSASGDHPKGTGPRKPWGKRRIRRAFNRAFVALSVTLHAQHNVQDLRAIAKAGETLTTSTIAAVTVVVEEKLHIGAADAASQQRLAPNDTTRAQK